MEPAKPVAASKKVVNHLNKVSNFRACPDKNQQNSSGRQFGFDTLGASNKMTQRK
jgi:hypothetical protein